MSKVSIVPVLIKSDKYEGVFHVNVDKTVQEVKAKLADHDEVELVSKQSEISRVGMVMKRVEQETKSKITSMKTANEIEKLEENKERRILFFKVIFKRE